MGEAFLLSCAPHNVDSCQTLGQLPLSLGAVLLLTGKQRQQGELITFLIHLALGFSIPSIFLAFFCLLIPLKYLAVSRSDSVLSILSSNIIFFFPCVHAWKLN